MRKYNYNNDLIWLDEISVTPPKSNNNITSSIGSFMYKNQDKISIGASTTGIVEQASNLGYEYYQNINSSPLTIKSSKYYDNISRLKYLKTIGKISGNIGTLLTITNLYTNIYSYQEGLISKNQFMYQMLSELGPMATMLVVSTIYGGPVEAAAGLSVTSGFTFGEFWYNGIVTASEKISYFNINLPNILLGGPYGHTR